MGGVMRPVGPESAETYWMRRALVVGAMLVLLIIVLIFLFNLGGSPGQAAPAPTQSAVPAGSSSSAPMTPSPTGSAGTPASSASPTPAMTATPSTSSTASPSAGSSASPTATASDKPTDKASDKPGKSSSHSDKHSSAKPSADSSTKASAKPSASPTPVAACTAKQLWPTLKSKSHNVKAGSKVAFGVSYVNRSDQACSVKINSDDYELKIYSGTDRIWSTDDCAKLIRATDTTLKPKEAVVWSVTWNGKRSAAGESCKNRPEMPQPGYYHATSQLKGTRSQDFLLILK